MTDFFRCLSLLLLGAPGAVGATGWFVNQQSVLAIGRAGAGTVVDPTDPAAAYFNPAALLSPGVTYPSGTGWSLGTQVLMPRASLRDLGSTASSPGTGLVAQPYPGTGFDNPTDPTPVPNLFVVHRLSDGRTALAAGLTSAFGLSSTFSPEWFGRYDSTAVSLETLNLTVSAARRLTDSLSIGGGIDWQHAQSDLQSALPDPFAAVPTPSTDGRTRLRGSGSGVGLHLGASWAATPALRVGAHYRSGMDIAISGTNTVQGLTGPLAAANGTVGATTELRMPAMAGLGVAWTASSSVTVFAQLDTYRWGRFGDLRVRLADGSADIVRPSGYRDASAVSLGLQWQRSESLALRAGVRREQTPTTDGFRDTTFPDGARTWLTAGASVRASARSTIDLSLKHAMFEDGRIDLSRSFCGGAPLATTVQVSGVARSPSVTTIGVAWRLRL
ncbi:MAG: outer membrane protein transport protein [Proteobacteria bacterium]|nr:outer membrane protein transport protein [Pseudomonadota bacterium]